MSDKAAYRPKPVYTFPLTVLLSLVLFVGVAFGIAILIQPANPEYVLTAGEAKGIPAYILLADALSALVTLPAGFVIHGVIAERSIRKGFARNKLFVGVYTALMAVMFLIVGVPLGMLWIAGWIGGIGGLFFLALVLVVCLALLYLNILTGHTRNSL